MATDPYAHPHGETVDIVGAEVAPTLVRAGSKTRIALAIVLLFSLGFCVIDLQLYFGVVEQHVAGFPNSTQFRLVILYPFTLTAINVVALIFCKRLPAMLLVPYMPVQILSFLILLFYAAGGI